MSNSNVVQFMSFNYTLTPLAMIKRKWKGLAERHIEEGASRIVASQSINKQVKTHQMRFISKNIWPIEKYNASKIDSISTMTWPVSVIDLGTFITASSDFKSLQTSTNLTAEMLTSSYEKCLIAVRCTGNNENSYVHHYRLGDELRNVVNDILCKDCDAFIGYVIYKRININNDKEDSKEESVFDWITEIYLDFQGSTEKYSFIEDRVQQFSHEGIDICYGLFKDSQCMPS